MHRETFPLLGLIGLAVLSIISFVSWRLCETPKRTVYRLLAEFHDDLYSDDSARSLAEIEADWESLGVEAVPALSVALHDPSCPCRYLAAARLAAISESAAVEPLLECLVDDDFVIRMWVIDALAKVGDQRAVIPVIDQLCDPKPAVRQAAADALARFRDRRAVGPLIACLTDDDLMTRLAAIRALGALEDKRALEAIRRIMQTDAADAVRQECLAIMRGHHE